MSKIRTATIWLDGRSGCHMSSFLDMDEGLPAVADNIELVYGPRVDPKVFPENVDLTIVEGAVSTIYTRSRWPSRVPSGSGHSVIAR